MHNTAQNKATTGSAASEPRGPSLCFALTSFLFRLRRRVLKSRPIFSPCCLQNDDLLCKRSEELQRLQGVVLSGLSEPAEGASQGYSGDKERGREREGERKRWLNVGVGKKRQGGRKGKQAHTHCKTDCKGEKCCRSHRYEL